MCVYLVYCECGVLLVYFLVCGIRGWVWCVCVCGEQSVAKQKQDNNSIIIVYSSLYRAAAMHR